MRSSDFTRGDASNSKLQNKGQYKTNGKLQLFGGCKGTQAGVETHDAFEEGEEEYQHCMATFMEALLFRKL